jgi:single-strand DNA-binding protein
MLNQCQFIGNLGADPDCRRSQQGKHIVRFRIACTERWSDKQGDRQEKTEWVPVVIFNESLATVAEKYLRKGSRVYVQGKFATSRWTDKDGAERYSTEVVLQGFGATLVLLDPKRDESPASDESQDSAVSRTTPSPQVDSEIPF